LPELSVLQVSIRRKVFVFPLEATLSALQFGPITDNSVGEIESICFTANKELIAQLINAIILADVC